MNNQGTVLEDKDMMLDMLAAQKQTTSTYSNFANECASPDLRNDMIQMLREEHEIQADLWAQINQRGWYPTCPAEQQKISEARQKYENMNPASS